SLRRGAPELEGRAQTLVAEARREPDVDDGDIRLLAENGMDERVGVSHLRHDLEVVVAEEPGEAVSQQRQILGDHDGHGSSARIVVGPPSGLEIESEPSSASTRRRSPARPPPSASAPPRPSSVTATLSAPFWRLTPMST